MFGLYVRAPEHLAEQSFTPRDTVATVDCAIQARAISLGPTNRLDERLVMQELTVARLRECLLYDEATGIFTWLRPRRRSMRVGQKAGYVDHTGYIQIQIDGRSYMAHRLAWLYVVGVWPTNQIDHKNGDRSCNAFANLRDVEQSTNLQNQRRAQSHNKSGYLGVHFEKATGKWRADISVEGKQTTIGRFDAPEIAYAQYLQAKRKNHNGCTL